MSSWAKVGDVVLYGDGLYRVSSSKPGPHGWRYNLEPFELMPGQRPKRGALAAACRLITNPGENMLVDPKAPKP